MTLHTPPDDPTPAILTGGGIIVAIVSYLARSVLADVFRRLAAAISDKRSTKEMPPVNGNAIKLAASNIENLIARIEALEAAQNEQAESQKVLARTQKEQVEYFNRQERDLEARVLIAAGDMINRRLVEPERKLNENIVKLETLRTDNNQFAQAVMSQTDVMQTAFQETMQAMRENIAMQKESTILMNKLIIALTPPADRPALPSPPSALDLAVNDDADVGAKLLAQEKRKTGEIKPPEIKPDAHKPSKSDKPGSEPAA